MTTPLPTAPLRYRVARALAYLVTCGLAWLLFLIGAISPLTPSEGVPSVAAIGVFVGGPVALLGLLAARVASLGMKLAAATQAVAIISLTAWLLSVQWR